MNKYTEKGRERDAERIRRRDVRQSRRERRDDIEFNQYITGMQGRNAERSGANPAYVAKAQQQANLYGDTIGNTRDRLEGYKDRGAARQLTADQGYATRRTADAGYLASDSILPTEQIRASTQRTGYVADFRKAQMQDATTRRGQDLGVADAQRQDALQRRIADQQFTVEKMRANRREATDLGKLPIISEEYEDEDGASQKTDYLMMPDGRFISASQLGQSLDPEDEGGYWGGGFNPLNYF